jgi:hypothetical protein
MAEPQPLDGRNAGTVTVNSVGAWADQTAASFASVTDAALATTAPFISVSIRETGGANPAYLLLRANAAEAVTLAWQIPAAQGEAFDVLLDVPVTTISVYGQVHIKALFGK